jgi:hypothetical protein
MTDWAEILMEGEQWAEARREHLKREQKGLFDYKNPEIQKIEDMILRTDYLVITRCEMKKELEKLCNDSDFGKLFMKKTMKYFVRIGIQAGFNKELSIQSIISKFQIFILQINLMPIKTEINVRRIINNPYTKRRFMVDRLVGIIGEQFDIKTLTYPVSPEGKIFQPAVTSSSLKNGIIKDQLSPFFLRIMDVCVKIASREAWKMEKVHRRIMREAEPFLVAKNI